MSASGNGRRDGLGLLGVGAVACAACCAGPILGLLAAIGIGTMAGVALFGAAGLLVAVLAVAALLWRRARRRADCRGAGTVTVGLNPRR